MAPVVKAVMKSFSWSRCAIIATTADLHTSLALATKQRLLAAGYKVFYHAINEIKFGDKVGCT